MLRHTGFPNQTSTHYVMADGLHPTAAPISYAPTQPWSRIAPQPGYGSHSYMLSTPVELPPKEPVPMAPAAELIQAAPAAEPMTIQAAPEPELVAAAAPAMQPREVGEARLTYTYENKMGKMEVGVADCHGQQWKSAGLPDQSHLTRAHIAKGYGHSNLRPPAQADTMDRSLPYQVLRREPVGYSEYSGRYEKLETFAGNRAPPPHQVGQYTVPLSYGHASFFGRPAGMDMEHTPIPLNSRREKSFYMASQGSMRGRMQSAQFMGSMPTGVSEELPSASDRERKARGVFKGVDRSGNGTLNLAQFIEAMNYLGVSLSLDDALEIFGIVDEDESACIDEEEFVRHFVANY